MKRWALLLLLTACGHAEHAPADLLDRATFKRTLLGAQLIEARINHELNVGRPMNAQAAAYYAKLFKDQGVSEEAFKHTFAWYAQHPSDLKPIYEEIVTELQQHADSIVH